MLLALLVLGSSAHAGSAEPPPEASRLRVSLEAGGTRTTRYEGEVLPLALRVYVSEAWLEEHGVPFARQPMDLPLRVRARALRASPRLTPVAQEAKAAGRAVSLALDDEVVADARWRGVTEVGPGQGEPARSVDRWLEIRRAFHVRGPGPLTLEAPEVDLVWAQEFRAGLLGERIAVDARPATVVGSALTLDVVPLPTAGRPADFQGWIGRYTLETDAHPTTLTEGETLRVALTIAGQGNHAVLPAPRLSPLEGMHVAGRLEERTPDGWKVHFELAPLAGTTSAIVGFALDVFDPERGEYVRAKSPHRRVDIDARPLAQPAPAQPATQEPAPTPPAERTPAKAPPWRLWLGIAALALILGVAGRRRRREAQAVEREEEAANALAGALERLVLSAGTPASGQALVEVLALHLEVPPAGVISPDLAQRLVRSGLTEDLAGQAARAVEAWVAARYAGPSASQDGRVGQDLARSLAAALAPPAA